MRPKKVEKAEKQAQVKARKYWSVEDERKLVEVVRNNVKFQQLDIVFRGRQDLNNLLSERRTDNSKFCKKANTQGDRKYLGEQDMYGGDESKLL